MIQHDLIQTAMAREIREIPLTTERLLAEQDPVASVADRIRRADPRVVVISGRGSSANAVGDTSVGPSGTLAERTEAFEKEVLLGEIRRHNFHMTNVARALGLERSHLYKKCQQLGIDLQSLRKPD